MGMKPINSLELLIRGRQVDFSVLQMAFIHIKILANFHPHCFRLIDLYDKLEFKAKRIPVLLTKPSNNHANFTTLSAMMCSQHTQVVFTGLTSTCGNYRGIHKDHDFIEADCSATLPKELLIFK